MVTGGHLHLDGPDDVVPVAEMLSRSQREELACDLDHRRPYDHAHPDRGGPTAPATLDALCEAHHRLRHETRRTHRGDPAINDSIRTDPTGRDHVTPATTLPAPPPVAPPADPAMVDRDDEPPPF